MRSSKDERYTKYFHWVQGRSKKAQERGLQLGRVARAFTRVSNGVVLQNFFWGKKARIRRLNVFEAEDEKKK